MRYSLLAMAVGLGCSFSSVAASGQKSTFSDPVLRLVDGEGVVDATRASAPVPVRRGATVKSHAKIACPQGCKIEIVDGGTVRLEPGGSLRDRGTTSIKTGAKPVPASWILVEGGATAEGSAQASRDILLETTDGAGVLVHAGASARIRSAEAKGASKTVISAFVGPVSVHQKRMGGTALAQGFAVEARGGHFERPVALPAAPSWIEGKSGTGHVGLAGAEGAAIVGGAWRAGPDGAHYFVEIASDPAFTSVMLAFDTTTPSFAESLPVGRYYTRVSSLDASSLGSPPSSPAVLRVVALSLPPGSLADAKGRAFVVPSGSTLRLGDGDAIEVALDYKRFSPADETPVSIGEQQKRTLWLRSKGDAASTSSYVIERRALHAEVEVTPRNAHWPSDPLVVTVRIVDPSGRVDPATIEPKLTGSFGVDPIAMQWKREGSTFKATIRPRSILENTIVRVKATDANDNELGSGFAEVAPSAPPAIAAR